ncbi:MAG: YifB family Mg chelatase-like AAA ATPase [Candidatus Vogelbacteria bacterium]|nr:YifB family Mg chelatase-like AAA ATPase [Candidatus Vogelbacteria bacterium]
MLSKVYSAQVHGLDAMIVTVEVDISKSLKSFTIVGLGDKAVGEAKDRISAAIKNSDFPSPHKGNKKTVVALAPADVKKEGTVFDLAIALGHLLASGEVIFDTDSKIFVGELALGGEVRPVRGALMIARLAKQLGYKELYLPEANALEAAIIDGVKIFPCVNLKQVVGHLTAKKTNVRKPEAKQRALLPNTSACPSGRRESKTSKSVFGISPSFMSSEITPAPLTKIKYRENKAALDFSDVRGQESAKRGLEIAAAGRHNIAMYGPPGTGKTMLAKAFLGILPSLYFDEVLEVTGIHSVAGHLEDGLITEPPFRSPHHSSSHVALIGGGANPKPGEITLAHRGVLFLDEFPEFDRRVIESLRQPLEDRVVHVSRAKGSAKFPANFILIAAMNPCPCGNKGMSNKMCNCTIGAIQNYEKKMSGPIMDRIDIWLEVPHIDYEKLSDVTLKGEISSKVRERVKEARDIAIARFQKTRLSNGEVGLPKGLANLEKSANSDMGVKELEQFAKLSADVCKLLNESARKLDLSARGYHRVIKLARTIADLGKREEISGGDVLEALQFRPRSLSNI